MGRLLTLEVDNDANVPRTAEVAVGSVPLPATSGLRSTEDLLVTGPDGQRLPAQLAVLSRWGGPLSDEGLPIQWLQVAVRVDVPILGRVQLGLERDPGAAGAETGVEEELSVSETDFGWVVDTGAARFQLDRGHPNLLTAIDVPEGEEARTVYEDVPGAGLRLLLRHDDGHVLLDTRQPGVVVPDEEGFELVASGPLRFQAVQRGHFVWPEGPAVCRTVGLTYDRFGYTLVVTLTAGSPHVDLSLHFRNECGDGGEGPWTDDAVTVDGLWLELPLGHEAGQTFFPVPDGTGFGYANGVLVPTVRISQPKGGGDPWSRRAFTMVHRDGAMMLEETGEAMSEAVLAMTDDGVGVAAFLPWMRHREPQAIEMAPGVVRVYLISEPLVVGEARGIWSRVRIGFPPIVDLVDAEAVRRTGHLEVERGLLVRASLADLNRAGVLPSLGTGAGSRLETEYRAMLEELHDSTVGAGGQWERARAWGSQLWPDTQHERWDVDHPSPADSSGAANDWNPFGVELLEFLRSGEPRWAWDLALPGSWLHAYSALYNLGDHAHGRLSGLSVSGGGSGEGHWHRGVPGHDDFRHNTDLRLSYVVFPTPTLRRRFRQAGRTVVARYQGAPEGAEEADREPVDLTRPVIEHLELLAGCARFVPGDDGVACDAALHELVGELVRDNLRAGLLCLGDLPDPTRCTTPYHYLQTALLFGFLYRYELDHAGRIPGLREELAAVGRTFYAQALPRAGDGRSIDVAGDFAASLTCTLAEGGEQVETCLPRPDDDDNLAMYGPSKLPALWLLLASCALQPSDDLCEAAKDAYDQDTLYELWRGWQVEGEGYWRGAAQMLQGVAYAVGGYDTCGGP